MKYKSLYFLLLIHLQLVAQWQDSNTSEYANILVQVDDFVKNYKLISYDVSYAFYADLKDSKPNFTYKGNYQKNENLLNISQFDIFYIQDQKQQLSIDSVEKVIILSSVDSTLYSYKSIQGLKVFINSKCIVKKKNENSKQIFSLQFSKNEKYSALEITFENKVISNVILYSKEQEIELENGIKKISTPKLAIDFFNYKFNNIKGTTLKDFSTVVALKDNKYFLKEKYTNYKFIDLRKNGK